MLTKASLLAFPTLFLSLSLAAPAAAQTAPDTGRAAACQRTISELSGAAARAPETPAAACNAPRETNIHGGWLDHAIMLVDLRERRSPDRPTHAAAQRTQSPPAFVLPAISY